ncbi:permease [Dermabacter sp. HMSC06F07]|uniref:Permease n=1 Tax=Dermabacter hominis 1368 TaxID=1450519 RepID=A0ABR4SM63_9MICO|nr:MULTISPECIES: NCS2 family permease [Dermabacter]KDS92906.1 permease [Dermabacter hominis 1368]MCT2025485.1 NCS2 family permease [Dermabacter hominis]MDK8803393.1 NCS2 family permease [Dermabacter hominis]OFT48565.1 permease [Dermabacter sp. HMSC06F07]
MGAMSQTHSAPSKGAAFSRLDSFFSISKRGSTVGREVRGGMVTFFAMCYIVVLNPLIIGTVPDSTGMYLGGGTEPNMPAVAAGTALIAAVCSIFMGAWANFPLAMAAGLGLNAYLAYGVVSLPGMTWAGAMGLVLVEGIIILLLVLTGFRKAVFLAVPQFLKTAIAVGMGLFIAFIGLINARFVTTGGGTPVQLGNSGSLIGWPTAVFVFGLILMIVLWVRKVPGAILIAIIAATVLAIVIENTVGIGQFAPATDTDAGNPYGWSMNVPALSGSAFALPDFSTLFQVDPVGGLRAIGVVGAIIVVFSLLLADFFDTMGTMVAVGTEAGLVDDNSDVENSQRILIADSVGAIMGGVGGVSSNTSFVESATGVGEGARTGLATVVTGLCFVVAMFLSPIVALVPYEAATPALVLVGFLMMSQVVDIDFSDLTKAIPAFLTIILMPFAYSITVGMGAGFILYVVIQIVVGNAKKVHWLMYVVSALFVMYFLRDALTGLIGL